MKKLLIPLSVLILSLACVIPGLPAQATPTAGNVEIATSTQRPTDTAFPTWTASPVLEMTSTAGESPIPTETFTSFPAPDLTTTPATATAAPELATVTQTASAGTGPGTATATLGILTYGTLPPEVPSTSIIIWNRSKAQAYISLQVTLNDGRYAIIEYPVAGKVSIDAPLGSYVYVAWVGGKKMVGTFRLKADESPTIILYKDKVVIQ